MLFGEYCFATVNNADYVEGAIWANEALQLSRLLDKEYYNL